MFMTDLLQFLSGVEAVVEMSLLLPNKMLSKCARMAANTLFDNVADNSITQTSHELRKQFSL